MAAARVLSKHSNRFVRFGYRRPPPWPRRPLEDSPTDTRIAPHPELESAEKLDNSNWREVVDPALPLVPVSSAQDPSLIPALAHGIDIVLRGDGVYPLEAPWIPARGNLRKHSKGNTLNYSDSLRKIVQPEQIAWNNIPRYVPAGSDQRLHDLASATKGVKYCSSTSSITPAIAALYHLLSNFRDTDLTGGLSSLVSDLPNNFAKMHRRPVAFEVKKASEGVLSVNAHAGPESGPTILKDLGHSMERMLTHDPAAFARKYVLSDENGNKMDKGLICNRDEEQFYHYSQVSRFLLRAQIDCRNHRTGEVFDVKTRAVAPIRYDLSNYQISKHRRLKFLRGKMDSYEREFYDMVRTVFLKYALQLRIGRMSGALVAYHNTTEILGLEYISLREIHSYVFGEERWADIAFGAAIHLLEEVLRKSTDDLLRGEPGERLKVVLNTEWSRLKMQVFVQRISDKEKDNFDSETFLRTELDQVSHQEGDRFDFRGATVGAVNQWHVDYDVHKVRRGIAAVGPHSGLRNIGGKKLSSRAEPSQLPKKRGPDSFNYTKYNTGSLNGDNFRVYNLHVFPQVNNELAPRNMIRLGENDTFRLKYQLNEVEDVRNEHLSKFVTSLGRIYVQ
eukprot:GFKZ01011917.1.p1 GENE.GFKZ01011917.1~~GFKZ01011917.1.p1  ORF type:complete len:618 (-),score=64.47 GFKZ01011917.1:248-2101(-)